MQFRRAAERTEKLEGFGAGKVRKGFLEEGTKLGLEALAWFNVWMEWLFFPPQIPIK